uniref:Coiled-coil domain-containing protein 137 n=1 Tax=Musca domestica TaxID=7370 RepID=A0A1I8M9D0_MUSDO
MARKRKIPARKHHGIRDPLRQLEEKEKKLKNIINAPPSRDNDQPLSFKMKQLKKLTEEAKSGKKIKRIHSGVEDKPKEAKTNRKNNKTDEGNKFKTIKQMPGEDDVDYLKRVNRITSASLKEAQYEAKYGVKVVRDPKTGAISIKKKPPNEIDELLKQKRKGGKANKKKNEKDVKPIDPKLAKQLIKQAIQEDEEERKQETSKETVEYQRDVFKFGEIVHAPPTALTLPRKAEKNETVPRPGKKNNLLLKSLLDEESSSSNSKPSGSSTKTTKSPGRVTKEQMRGKRKDLPEHTRNMLEKEREKLVELYRNLKKSKGIMSDKS